MDNKLLKVLLILNKTYFKYILDKIYKRYLA